MSLFDRNDPRYLSCCGEVHVSTLARVFLVLSTAAYALACYWEVSDANYFPLFGILVVLLGVYGVFRERRKPLLAFIVLAITLTVVWMLSFQAEVAANPEDRYPPFNGLAVPAAVCLCLFISSIQYFVYMTFWNLSKFIKHRDDAMEKDRFANV